MPLTSQSESHGKVQSDRGKKKAMTWRSAGDADKGVNVKGLVAQSCPLLCDPMDRGPPSSPIHGILQARILEWVAISFGRRSS